MNTSAQPPVPSDDCPATPRVVTPSPRAWVADFVPISPDDPALRAVLLQLQWALDTESQW